MLRDQEIWYIQPTPKQSRKKFIHIEYTHTQINCISGKREELCAILAILLLSLKLFPNIKFYKAKEKDRA